MDTHRLHQDTSEVLIAARGAELQALRLGGADLLWTAGALWPRHAPLLFPVVGALRDDRLRHQGRTFPMPKHGFTRERDFTWTARTDTHCTLELRDDEDTRQAFPFPFRLQVTYRLGLCDLRMELELTNAGDAPMPASLGLHPAFRWPLLPGTPKSDHRLRFDEDEPGPLRRIDDRGLLQSGLLPTPIRGRELLLHEGLFEQDALIFLEPRSRGLQFKAKDGPSLTLRWEGFPHLGIWTKPDPGPSFLCIEPWAGHASPGDWEGEFSEKPGGFILPPGGLRRWMLAIGYGL